MLRFRLPQHAKALLRPDAIRIIGPEDLPAAGEVAIEDDSIVVRCESPDSRGIAVRLDADALCRSDLGLGETTLLTCLLPQRERPYDLVLELARRRLMLLLNKIEEWSLFEGDVGSLIDRSREAFTEALVAAGGADGPSADAREQAFEALRVILDASRSLALSQRQSTLPARLSGELHAMAVERYERAQQEPAPPGAPILLAGTTGVILPGRPLLGCEVDPRIFSEGLARIVASSCDFLSTPLRWSDLEPSEGTYSFAATDRWIEWAVRTAKMPVAGGPLIDFRPSRTPDWLEIWENDHETLRDLVAEHVKQIVTRYRRTIRRWSVVNGLAVNRYFPMDFEQMIDLTRIAVTIVRRLHPQANIIVEIDQPWGEYCSSVSRAIPPLAFAEMTQQAQIPADGFALRLSVAQDDASWTYDPMEVSAMLDRYAACLERPILITGLGAPAEGHGFDEGRQRAWFDEMMGVLLAKPYIHSVCWQSLYDTEGTSPVGLISRAGVPRPVAHRFAEIRTALREGRSPWTQTVGVQP